MVFSAFTVGIWLSDQDYTFRVTMESTEFGNESVGVRGRDQQFGDYMTCFRREQKNLTDKLLRFRVPDRIVGQTY